MLRTYINFDISKFIRIEIYLQRTCYTVKIHF